MRPRLIVIAGPTASGKSSLAMEVAARLPAVIISADSRQVYRHFDIGTAKPTLQERAAVPHELIDVAEPTEAFTVATFVLAARQAIRQALDAGRIPLVVGGTGFYIRALLGGTAIPEVPPDPARRAMLMALPDLHARLATVDPEAAARLHPNDRFRLARALEVFEATGRPLSSYTPEPCPWDVAYFALAADLAELEGRIAARTTAMLAAGWRDEVEALVARYGAELPLLQTLGYAELMVERQTGQDPVPTIIQNTRQYARRQQTWFRGERDVHWLPVDRQDNVEAILASAQATAV